MKLVSLAFFVSSALHLQGAEISSTHREFFESKIRPVLAEHCYKCHAVDAKKIKGGLLLDSKWGWEKGGDTGPVIVPGQPEESILMEMVRHDPDAEAMPPKYKLKDHEIADLENWIKMGAPDPRPKLEVAGKKRGYDAEERRQWWSLQSVQNPALPKVQKPNWVQRDLDAFVLKELENKNWEPAAKADKLTLLKRVSYDLTGLPPTPEEQEAFLKESSPKAYEKVVDRLLASERFGEAWARKWMDLMRYSESKAFEADYTMPHVWKYRDYLIKVFNEDVPYNQFILETLAGDLLPEPRKCSQTGKNESIKGPGFYYLTPGHHGPPDMHGDEVRVFDNMIDVIGKSFLATTISCARCHDHKFDAVSAKNFYSLYGIIASSRLDFRDVNPSESLKTKNQELETLTNPIRADQARQWRKDIEAFGETLSQNLDNKKYFEAFKKEGSHYANLYPIFALGQTENKFKNIWSRFANWKPERVDSIEGLSQTSKGRWLTSGVAFGEGPRSNSTWSMAREGKKALQGFVGSAMAAGVLHARQAGSLKSPTFKLEGNNLLVKVKGRGTRVNLMVHHYELVGKGPTTAVLSKQIDHDTYKWISFPLKLWQGASAYLDIQLNSESNHFVARGQHHYKQKENAYVAIDQVVMRDLKTEERLMSDWSGLKPAQTKAEAIQQLKAYLLSLVDAFEKGRLTSFNSQILNALLEGGQLTSPVNETIKKYRDLVKKLLVPDYVRSMADGHGQDERVYIRGLHKNISKEANPRHFLDATSSAPFQIQGSGRLAWAENVVDESNPLTARVAVNRLWHHIFGRGLVASVDDFGKMGDQPTHPDLLDYMATQFVQKGWSVKAMLRDMVLSQTYQMSSRPSQQAGLEDPDNKFLQRMPVRRLEAEAIRDTILYASGELKHQLYGPSIATNLHETPNSRSKPGRSGPVDGSGRRSVYQELRKNFMPHFLVSFDMPSSSAPFGRRAVTNVPSQSLVLMNDPFVHEQAQKWAHRVLALPGNFQTKIEHLHRNLFSRPARESEVQWAEESLAQFAKEQGIPVEQAKNNVDCWTQLCHVMYNRKEMLYKF